ncbi:MAG TPA: polyphosphate kinase 1 [Soehngenia sp.]|nr:polyphosphate kinase 1 [Soehngenia sp.]HPP31186.1 polyphosphate kinase 1 [Soehngenia sp.]
MAETQFPYDTSYTQNRELSWLKFNERVLDEALDETVPLFERLKFIAIFSSNLDEFFMIRVGSLLDLSRLKNPPIDNKTGLTPQAQLENVFENVKPLYKKKDELFFKVENFLREYGIYNLDINELTNSEFTYVEDYFKKNIMPLLSPQIIDSHHPFPHLWNKNLYVIGSLGTKDKTNLVGIIEIPKSIPRVLYFGNDNLRYILIEKIILYFFNTVFSYYKVSAKSIISVTRNADINPKDEAFDFDEEDFKIHMKQILKKRSRLAPVRLEIYEELDKDLKNYLIQKLNISQNQVFKTKSPIMLDYVLALEDKLSPTLKSKLTYHHFDSLYPPELNPKKSIISQVQNKDVLMIYPYEDIKVFLDLLKEASQSKKVKSIKISLYRLANKSKVVEYLCEAKENGKDVTVLIELRARFDEQNNIEWAERLEESGCNVIYGIEDYKVHSKICLITCVEKDKISYITQIGTGNYNEKTAKLYSDLSLITGNKEIGLDALEFFKNMAISCLDGDYRHLAVAPYSLKNRLIDEIDKQIENAKHDNPSRIIIKANSITERDLIDKLMQASCAGVKIDLIIRGICCILPNIKGRTENITVTNIVGRFLEHSRIYLFGEGEKCSIYISSADLMTRNLNRRVEIAAPVYDMAVKEKIEKFLELNLKDNQKSRIMTSSGDYVKKEVEKELFNCQEYLLNLAQSQGESRPLKRRFYFIFKLFKSGGIK